MSGGIEPRSAVEAVVVRSRSTDTGIRVAAVQALGQWSDRPEALERLIEMLSDRNVTVMVDAAEMLARRGGCVGIRAIVEEIGRSAEDADVDYLVYKLEELEALGEVSILDVVRSFDASQESAEFRSGSEEVERYMGDHYPK